LIKSRWSGGTCGRRRGLDCGRSRRSGWCGRSCSGRLSSGDRRRRLRSRSAGATLHDVSFFRYSIRLIGRLVRAPFLLTSRERRLTRGCLGRGRSSSWRGRLCRDTARSAFSDVGLFRYSLGLIGGFVRAPFLLTSLYGSFVVPMQERTGRRFRREPCMRAPPMTFSFFHLFDLVDLGYASYDARRDAFSSSAAVRWAGADR
jgi:hypothetical protein